MLPGNTKPLFGGAEEVGNDNYTVLLLHFNTDYIDYSLGHTGPVRTFIRRAGAQRGIGTPRFGKGCLYVGGAATGGLTTPNHADWDFGNGNWTVDYWCYRPGTAACMHFAKRSDQQYAPWLIMDVGSGSIVFYASSNNTSWDVAATVPMGTVPINVWTHVAVVRNGNTIQGYINGVKSGTTITTTATLYNNAGNLQIGGEPGGNSTPYYFDEIRISKGIARWVANFTPPSKPYGPNPNRDMLLLIHFDEVNGTIAENLTESSMFNRKPFYKDGAVAAATPGGNLGAGVGYFPTAYFVPNQSVDFDFMDDDFTMEWWEARSDPAAGTGPSFTRDNSAITYQAFLIGWNEAGIGKFYWSENGSTWGAGSPLVMGALSASWTHFAIVRKGTTMYTFRNGVLQDSRTVAAGMTLVPAAGSQYLAIGWWNYGPGYKFTGYMDEIRIDKIARYTANFSPPALPYGADPDEYAVRWYVRADGADGSTALADSSTWLRATTSSGGAQIQSNALMIIPNGYVTTPNDGNLGLYGKDFTIETWIMVRGLSSGNYRYYTHALGSGDSNANGVFLGFTSSLALDLRIHVSGAAAILLNTAANTLAYYDWRHVAFCRVGNKWSVYVDGIERATQTAAVTVPFASQVPILGTIAGGSEWFNGYLNDFKLVIGKSLYAANFTPPAKPVIPWGVQAATRFVVTTSVSTIRNATAFTLYVRAYNAYGYTVNHYGTVSITSSAGGYATCSPNNVAIGSAGDYTVTLDYPSAGTFTFTATSSSGGITGTSAGVSMTRGPASPQTIYLSAAGAQYSFTIPSDWTNNNSVEVIAGGAGGWSGDPGYGGGGGGYGKSVNLSFSPGQVVSYYIGPNAGWSAYGGDAWFASGSHVYAQGGQANGGGGVYAANYVAYAGGNGGVPQTWAGGGGGGAAGPYGGGAPGGHGDPDTTTACGGGGGGSGGGAGGGTASPYYGGNGGNSYAWGGGGAGSNWYGANYGGSGVYGGGGGGTGGNNNYFGGAGNGGNGPEYQADVGSGGGGGGAGGDTGIGGGPIVGGNGGYWGGGGGGSGLWQSGGGGAGGGVGIQGLIIVKYQ